MQTDWEALIDKENISCHYFWSSSPFKFQSVLIFVYIFGLILQFETGQSVKLVLISFDPEK
jgi:hypothetical protein